MPEDQLAYSEDEVDDLIGTLLPSKEGRGQTKAPIAVKQLQLRSADCREDFEPISSDSPVAQYSRAYLYHLHEVRELLGTMILAKHNICLYASLFDAIRKHILQGTFRSFVAWFLRTQTCDAADAVPEPALKRRKR